MYILHYPIIAATKVALAPLRLEPAVEYVIAVVVGGVGAYAFHVGLVKRLPFLMFLLNGHHERKPTTRAAISDRPIATI